MKFFLWLVDSVLILFTARRYLFWLASYLPARRCSPARISTIGILVAAQNEELLLPRNLAALERFTYPRHLLSFVLVSDGSTDSTFRLMQNWCSDRDNAVALALPARSGKAAALAAALACCPDSELIVVTDADTEPTPDALARLAGAFADPKVGAACGYPRPANAAISMVSRYAALERWVYHLVTMAGKDRLGLNPPAIGALSAFRRRALVEAGGFPAVGLEDIYISRELTRRGWRTRWIGEAVTREDVPTSLDGFLQQRTRWSRGLLAGHRQARGIEDAFVAAGYLDRVVFVIALALAVAGQVSGWLPFLYVTGSLAAILTALAHANAKGRVAYLTALLPMFAVDFGVTAASALAQFAGSPLDWAQRRTRD